MAAETFFADPSFEGFNLLFEAGADSQDLTERAQRLVAERLGLSARSEPVGADHGSDGAPLEVDLVVDAVDHPDVASIWDLTYELRDMAGVVDAEPLWELSQDQFAEEPDVADEAEIFTRIGIEPPPGARPATRRGDGIEGPTADIRGGPPPADLHWSVKMVEAPAAWQLPPTPTGAARGQGALVGHPDSGFIDHYELHRPGETPDRFLEQRGFDFLDGGDLQSQDGTHGTSTASVIMSSDEPAPDGRPNVMGIAPEAEIIPYRVTKKHGIVPSPILFRSGARRLRDAIYRATADGCDVISISLGWMKLRSLHRAIQHAVDNDVIVLAAAGNYVWRVVWPARYPEVIAVAGCTHNGQKWWGSSRGKSVDITAPAQDVYRATVSNGVGGVEPGDGTSYAVATVAGVAALWVAHHGRQALLDRYQGQVRLAEVFNHVLASSANPGPVDHDGRFGRGIADAEAALRSPLPSVAELTAPVARMRSAAAVPAAAPLDDEFELDEADDRARHAMALGLAPSDLDADLDDLSDELFFHIFTDPVRREAALGPDSVAVGELRHGVPGPAASAAGPRRGGRAGADVVFVPPPAFSQRLSARLAGQEGDGGDDGDDRTGDGRGGQNVTLIDDQQISDDFVVVGADLTVADAIDMMRATGADFAVVHRWEGQEQYYYVRVLEQFLQVHDETQSVLDGLGLHEWQADQTVPAHAPGGDPGRSIVVLDGASVVGVVAESPAIPQAVPRPQPRRPARRSARRGGLPRMAAPEPDSDESTGAEAEEVTRHLSAEHPERAAVGDELNVLVTMASDAVAGAISAGFEAAVGASVEVILSTRSGVEVIGADSHTFPITADGVPQLARFKVRAVAEGMASFRLMAFIGTSNVANLPMTIEVGATAPDSRGTTTVEVEMEEEQADPPDLMLLIYEALDDGQPTLRFQVHGTDPGLKLNMRSFDPVKVRRDPEEYFSTYFADIEALLDPGNLTADEIDRQLQVKGSSLYEEIVPEELRMKLWEVRDRVSSVLIQSTDPWVPWEMCFLSGPDENGLIVDHGFVCEHYDVSRWIQGQPLHQELSLAKLGLVVTGDSGLPVAIAEGDFVEELQQRSDAGVERVESKLAALTEALASGSFTGFHFTGHGLFTEETDPDRTKIMLEDHKPFRAENISGRARNLAKGTPIVFLNACQAGRSGMSLADAGGWARAMIGAGAGAFIGAHWSVLDDSAGGFARVFYERLLHGDTLAAAVRKARLSVRTPGDPTWLAYVLYADPAATISERFN